MDNDQLVVSGASESYAAAIFMYHLDQATGKWMSSGQHHPPGQASYVTLKGNVVVATVNEYPHPVKYKEVVGVLYRRSSQNRNMWENVATLKTNDVPTSDELINIGVSIINGLVFTG